MSSGEKYSGIFRAGLECDRAGLIEDLEAVYRDAPTLKRASELPRSRREESREFQALRCAMDYMLWRLPVPDWAAELLVDAWYEFEMLRHPSFLAALGLPDRDRLGAKSRSRVARDAVIMVIYRHNVRGIALKSFAFEEAAEFYGLSASVVEKAYYRMQKTEQFQMFEADAKGERRLEYCCPSPEMIEEERRRGR